MRSNTKWRAEAKSCNVMECNEYLNTGSLNFELQMSGTAIIIRNGLELKRSTFNILLL